MGDIHSFIGHSLHDTACHSNTYQILKLPFRASSNTAFRWHVSSADNVANVTYISLIPSNLPWIDSDVSGKYLQTQLLFTRNSSPRKTDAPLRFIVTFIKIDSVVNGTKSALIIVALCSGSGTLCNAYGVRRCCSIRRVDLKSKSTDENVTRFFDD